MPGPSTPLRSTTLSSIETLSRAERGIRFTASSRRYRSRSARAWPCRACNRPRFGSACVLALRYSALARPGFPPAVSLHVPGLISSQVRNMARIAVEFVYLTGLKREIFSDVRLTGSWNSEGRFSDRWSVVPMEQITGEDGCPAFRAQVELDASQAGWTFRWGVILDGPGGHDQWGIPTEVSDLNSMDQTRSFTLDRAASGATPQQEHYYLIYSRRLGAQKHRAKGRQNEGIRFAVWAPNAQKVEVVMGTMWDMDDPRRTPAQKPLTVQRIGGGYIADDGTGVRTDLGPFPMTRFDDGVWVTDENDPRLADFAKFDHKPYMFRVTKDNGRVAYRTDLYSRCQVGSGKYDPEGKPYFGKVTELDGKSSCSV